MPESGVGRGGFDSAAPSAASPAFADYPEREVKIIVPFPAGGTADIAARVVAAELGKSWNKPLVVDNKAGAGGNVGGMASPAWSKTE